MLRRKSTGWESFYTIADCAGTPDTTMIADPDSFALNARSTTALDLYAVAGAGASLDAVWLEFIFSVSDAADGDGKTTVFELYASNDNGPIHAIVSLALTGGKARVTAASDLVNWCDTAVATDYRGMNSAADEAGLNFQVIVNDSGNDNVVSVMVPVLGMRYWEALFTGADSTATVCTAYYRWFTE